MRTLNAIRINSQFARASERVFGIHWQDRWMRLWMPLIMVSTIALGGYFGFLFIIKLFLAIIGYGMIYFVGASLVRRKTIFIICLIFAGLVTTTNIVRPAGPYSEVIAYPRGVSGGTLISTEIQLFKGSSRWDYVKSGDGAPFVFVSINQKLEDDEVRLIINGDDLGSLQEIPGTMHGSGAYSVPISAKYLANDAIKVDLEFNNQDRLIYVATATILPNHDDRSRQSRTNNSLTRLVSDFYDEEIRYIVEVRLADKNYRTLGILF
jgi:hypothetical protein